MTNEKVEFTEELYESGKRIIECLDKEGFNYPIVLWFNFPDKGWTLLFGIPGLKVIGRNDVLGNVRRIIRENNLSISVDKIMVIDSLDKLCINLRTRIKKEDSGGMIRLSRTQVGDMIIPESVIYRII